MFSKTNFDNDFYLDQTMLRRIKRAAQSDRNRDYDESRMEEFDEDEDENMISDTSALPDESRGPAEASAANGARKKRSVSRVPKRERMSYG
jgi:hypothetical protein